MSLQIPCTQPDLFSVPTDGPGRIVLRIGKIQAPMRLDQRKRQKETGEAPRRNFHVPSFKNAKTWLMKLPNGKPLEKPILITVPEFQRYMEKVVASLESQLLCYSPTGPGGTPLEPSKLFAIAWSLPADDSCSDLPEGAWKVRYVNPGEEGAEILIERLT